MEKSCSCHSTNPATSIEIVESPGRALSPIQDADHMDACAPNFASQQVVCVDPFLHSCAGAAIMPSVFFVFNDTRKGIVPLVAKEAGGTWAGGDFRFSGPLNRLRAAIDFGSALVPHQYRVGNLTSTALVGSEYQFETFPTNQLGNGRAVLIYGFAIGLTVTSSVLRPSFRMGVRTVGYSSVLPYAVPNLRTFYINVNPWMYDSGWIVFLPTVRVTDPTTGLQLTDQGLYSVIAFQPDDDASVRVDVDSGLNAVRPSVIVLGPDSDIAITTHAALEHWAQKLVRRDPTYQALVAARKQGAL